MISTCVHCKKQFEWTTQGSCFHFVYCCHCDKASCLQPGNGREQYPTVSSKPLQVAKKWVVKQWQGDGYLRWLYLDTRGYFGALKVEEAAKFNDGTAAVRAMTDFMLRWAPCNIEKLVYEQVDA